MFSKIKIDLLKNKKVKGYLSYAKGEIVLIVIGISIAVNINNVIDAKKKGKHAVWHNENHPRRT
ncbi:MAG: hypothetical protein KGY51_08470 [Psychroflexus sp.]|nr:hypothetical protein [Psychroflexus sp.]